MIEAARDIQEQERLVQCFATGCLSDHGSLGKKATGHAADLRRALSWLRALGNGLSVDGGDRSSSGELTGDRSSSGLESTNPSRVSRRLRKHASSQRETIRVTALLLRMLHRIACVLDRAGAGTERDTSCGTCHQLLWYGAVFVLRGLSVRGDDWESESNELDLARWYVRLLTANASALDSSGSYQTACAALTTASASSDGTERFQRQTMNEDNEQTSCCVDLADDLWRRHVGLLLARDALSMLEGDAVPDREPTLPELIANDTLEKSAPECSAQQWLHVFQWVVQRVCRPLVPTIATKTPTSPALETEKESAFHWRRMLLVSLRIFLVAHALGPASIGALESAQADSEVRSIVEKLGHWLVDESIPALEEMHSRVRLDASQSSWAPPRSFQACFESTRDVLLSALDRWRGFRPDFGLGSSSLLPSIAWVPARLYVLRIAALQETELITLVKIVCQAAHRNPDSNTKEYLFSRLLEVLLAIEGDLYPACVLRDEWLLHWLVECWANPKAADACQQLASHIQHCMTEAAGTTDSTCVQDARQAVQVLRLASLLSAPNESSGAYEWEGQREAAKTWPYATSVPALLVLVRNAHRHDAVRDWIVEVALQVARDGNTCLDPRFAQRCLVLLQEQLQNQVTACVNREPISSLKSNTSQVQGSATAIAATAERLFRLVQSLQREASGEAVLRTGERERLRQWAAAVLHNAAADLYEYGRSAGTAALETGPNRTPAHVQDVFASAAQCWQGALTLGWLPGMTGDSCAPARARSVQGIISTGIGRLAYGMQAWIHAAQPCAARSLWSQWSELLWTPCELEPSPEGGFETGAPPPWDLCMALFRLAQAICPNSASSDKLRTFLEPISTKSLYIFGIAMDRLWRRTLRLAHIDGRDPSKAATKWCQVHLILDTVMTLLAERSLQSDAMDTVSSSAILEKLASSTASTNNDDLVWQTMRPLLQSAIRLLHWQRPFTTGMISTAALPTCSGDDPQLERPTFDEASTDAAGAFHDALHQLLQYVATRPLAGMGVDDASEACKPNASSLLEPCTTEANSRTRAMPSTMAERLVRLAKKCRHSDQRSFSRESIAVSWLAWWCTESVLDGLELAARLFHQTDQLLAALHCTEAMRCLAQSDPWRQALYTARAMLLCQQLEWDRPEAIHRNRLARIANELADHKTSEREIAPSELPTWCRRVLQFCANNPSTDMNDALENLFEADAQQRDAGVGALLWRHAQQMRTAKRLAANHALVEAIETANGALARALQAQLLLPADSSMSRVPLLGQSTLVVARPGAIMVGDLVTATLSRPVEPSELSLADVILEEPSRALCRTLDLLALLSTYLGAWKDALYYNERAIAICRGSDAACLAAALSHSLMHQSLLLTRCGQAELAEQYRREALALYRIWDGALGLARSLWALPLAYRQTQLALFRVQWQRRIGVQCHGAAANRQSFKVVEEALERTWRLVSQEATSRCSGKSVPAEIAWHTALRLLWGRALLLSASQRQEAAASNLSAAPQPLLDAAIERLQPLLETSNVPFPAYLEAIGLYLASMLAAHANAQDAVHPLFEPCWQQCRPYLLPLVNGAAGALPVCCSLENHPKGPDRVRRPLAPPEIDQFLLGGLPWIVASAVYSELARATLSASMQYRRQVSLDLLLHGAGTVLRAFAPRWRHRCALMRRPRSTAAATWYQPSFWDRLEAPLYLERLVEHLPPGWMILALCYDPMCDRSVRIAVWRTDERAPTSAVGRLTRQLAAVRIQNRRERQTSPSWTQCVDHCDCRSWRNDRGDVWHLQTHLLEHDDARPQARQLEQELQQLLHAAAKTHIATETEAQSMSARERRAWWQTRAHLDERFGHWLEHRLETLFANGSASPSPLSSDASERAPNSSDLDPGTRYGSVNTVLLLVDAEHDRLPLEATPTLRNRTVMRFPASAALEDALERLGRPDALASTVASMSTASTDVSVNQEWRRGAFLINPAGDLGRTERFLRPLLTDKSAFALPHGWSDLGDGSGDAHAKLVAEQPSVLLYCGHGAGEAYLQPRRLARQTDTIPHTVFLMGCRSGHVEHAEALDSHGVVLDWLAAGAQCVVAQLWDVTDGDLDRLTVATWEHLAEALRPDRLLQRGGEQPSAAGTSAARQRPSQTSARASLQVACSVPGSAETVRSQPTNCPATTGPETRQRAFSSPLDDANAWAGQPIVSPRVPGSGDCVETPLGASAAVSVGVGDSVPAPFASEAVPWPEEASTPAWPRRSTGALVARAVRAARPMCRLRWVNGAATVVYGLAHRTSTESSAVRVDRCA